MEVVTVDKTGKIYIPKTIREEMTAKEYYILALPDGDIILHQRIKPKDPLKEFEKLTKIIKPISEVKKDILNEALGEAK